MEKGFERLIFASRWLMAPMYLGLVAVLGMMLAVFLRQTFYYVPQALTMSAETAILAALSLIDQTIEAFENEGIYAINVMQGNHPRKDPNPKVHVISVQTLAKRERPDVGMVIVDECHIRSKVASKPSAATSSWAARNAWSQRARVSA